MKIKKSEKEGQKSLLNRQYKLQLDWSSDIMTFGEKLKLLRYEKGLTQDDLGYVLNVTKSCISCYENGTRQPSVDMLISISVYFKVSIDYLVGFEESNPDDRRDIEITKSDVSFLNELKNKPSLYKKVMKSIPKVILKLQKMFK